MLSGPTICVLFLLTLVQRAEDLEARISPEILAITQANQNTREFMKVFDATITEVTDHDHGKKGRRGLRTKERIRYDGAHLRVDVLESEFLGGEETSRSRSVFAPPEAGEFNVESKDFSIDYRPSNNIVWVRPSEWDRRVTMNTLLRFQSALGASLEENVLASAKNRCFFSSRPEKLGSDDCIRLSCEYPKWDQDLRIWVVPSKGYTVKRVQVLHKGKTQEDYTTTLKEYEPGLWWFDTVEVESVAIPQKRRIEVNALTIRPRIDPKIFSIDGLGVSDQTRVIYDTIDPELQRTIGPKVGDVAPDFDVETFDGTVFRLKEKHGKVVWIYFWGTWCAPCVRALPSHKQLHDQLKKEFGDRFEMLSISFKEPPERPAEVAKLLGLSWPQAAIANDEKIISKYKVTGAPTSYVIGPKGRILSTDVGIEKAVRRALASK